MRTLGQKRAEFALNEVLNIQCDKKEFKAFSAGAPSMILQNGFGQTLAFWLSKRTEKHFVIFDLIKKWLSYKNGDIDNRFTEKIATREEFIKLISTMEQSDYLAAQKETLSLLEWVKRYANADL